MGIEYRSKNCGEVASLLSNGSGLRDIGQRADYAMFMFIFDHRGSLDNLDATAIAGAEPVSHRPASAVLVTAGGHPRAIGRINRLLEQGGLAA